MEIFRSRFDSCMWDKTYKDLALNRIFGVEDLPTKIKLDRKIVADILFTASVTAFLYQRNNGPMWIFKEDLN